jgi:hypothetical protein
MTQSYSQAGQDLYALQFNKNKLNGYFIDIGCQDPIFINNTYLLEQHGWNGLSFDIENYHVSYQEQRKTKFIQCDALQFNFKTCFEENNVPLNIDYLSLDIDTGTYDCLIKLPFDSYTFNCITIEHDEYYCGSEIKFKIKNYLENNGYLLHKSGIEYGGNSFEDWYVWSGAT